MLHTIKVHEDNISFRHTFIERLREQLKDIDKPTHIILEIPEDKRL